MIDAYCLSHLNFFEGCNFQDDFWFANIINAVTFIAPTKNNSWEFFIPSVKIGFLHTSIHKYVMNHAINNQQSKLLKTLQKKTCEIFYVKIFSVIWYGIYSISYYYSCVSMKQALGDWNYLYKHFFVLGDPKHFCRSSLVLGH